MDLQEIFEKCGIPKEYKRGTEIFKEGAPATYALLITEGVVQIARAREGKQFIIAVRSEGDILGEMVFDGQPRLATATAISDVKAIYIATETFRRIVYEEPEVTMQLFTVLLQRLKQATEQVGDMALVGVYERLRKFLISNLQETDELGVTTVQANFQMIGNHLGASRDMISKIFKELIRGEYVKLDDGVITIARRLPLKM